MKELWDNLSPKDRRIVIAGAVVLAMIIAYMAIRLPMSNRVDRLQDKIIEQQVLLQWMQKASAEATALRAMQTGSNVRSSGSSLLALVDQTARSRQLGPAIRRVEPKGDNAVRVQLEGAAFDSVVAWLDSLNKNYGITVDTVSIDRQGVPGQITASLILQGSSG